MHPTALYHMVVSSSQSYADRLLSIEAEQGLGILKETAKAAESDTYLYLKIRS